MPGNQIADQLETIKTMLTWTQTLVRTKDYGKAMTQINEAAVGMMAIAVSIQRIVTGEK